MKRSINSLSARMLVAQLLVISIGAITMFALVQMLAPSFFSDDVQRMNEMMSDPSLMGDGMMSEMMTGSTSGGFLTPSLQVGLQDAFNSAFRSALVISLIVASIAAAWVSRFVTRRILSPLESVRLTTRKLASGAYDQRIELPAERELAELADDVNELADALESTEQRRVRLISEIAHELRTPLTTIEGYVEGMLDGVFEPNDEILAASGRELRRLKRLADDLSAVSKAEEGNQKLEFKVFDLAKLAESVIDDLRLQFDAKDVDVSVVASAPTMVLGDRDRLAQVLTNLIGNSVAYTEQGGRVAVSVFSDGTQAVATVTDTGRGLTPEEQTAVFERFYRGDHSGPGGSGIGLTIARAIARRHRGEIIATSPGRGKGSTFELRLPLS